MPKSGRINIYGLTIGHLIKEEQPYCDVEACFVNSVVKYGVNALFISFLFLMFL